MSIRSLAPTASCIIVLVSAACHGPEPKSAEPSVGPKAPTTALAASSTEVSTTAPPPGQTHGSPAVALADVSAPTAKPSSEPRAQATLSEPAVSGGRIVNATSVVARLRGRIRKCYVAALTDEPRTAKQAELRLHMKVDAEGNVVAVRAEAQEPTLHATVRCIASQIKQQTVFASPTGGKATVSFDVRLERLE
jgi:hypothetical protein